VTLEGLSLGISAVKAWTRKKFKGCNALKKKINSTRVPIEEKESVRWLENLRQSTALLNEPQRCVHIGDRESDIYELFCEAQNIGTHFLVWTCVDRLAGDGKHTIADEMREVRVKGLHRIEVRDAKGDHSQAILELRYRRIRVLPPSASSSDTLKRHSTSSDAAKLRHRDRTARELNGRRDHVGLVGLLARRLHDNFLPPR